ncbi:MAG: DEAD/DEAH box helicase family protein, partial [Parvularcula sp.]|nr:DEAD/DEAH box helicase family protein [Parvularcula sp.]
MSEPNFFEAPILNSPYRSPGRHWELDEDGRPTNRILDRRRRADLVTPIPKTKKKGKRSAQQTEMALDAGDALSSFEQRYNPTAIINEIRDGVATWRNLPESQWQVTPETARLLKHWRSHEFQSIRPFFCQVEAVETAIWLAEVASRKDRRSARFLNHLREANDEANPELFRIALKLATGAGKTTVMAMLIAWQVVNAARHPNSKSFSRGFLIVAPGITIRDRLRVLLPSDPESYYRTRELVPADMLPEIAKAKIVITNYHAFKHRERMPLSKGTRSFLKGREEGPLTLETDGQMLQRVMPDLMGLKNVVVINDEAHHCYRERPGAEDEALKGDEKKEAEENKEAARLWISGIEAVKRKLGVRTVYDLSATPFFLQGSGYIEGSLFPWTVSDFSLIDAIECGIVKLPRVPIADNLPSGEEPLYRKLWDAIGKKMPKKAKGEKKPDPLKLPLQLQTALEALYGHYRKTFEAWENEKVGVPPVFIVVCNNTTNSELVHDYIAGFERKDDAGKTTFHQGRLELFRN